MTSRAVALAALLMALSAVASAYEPPNQWVQDFIRAHSNSDTLWILPYVDEDCGLEDEAVDDAIDRVMILSRIEQNGPSPTALFFHVAIELRCQTFSDTTVYALRVSFEILQESVWWRNTSLGGAAYMWLGIHPQSADLIEAIKVGLEHILADFIYSHSN